MTEKQYAPSEKEKKVKKQQVSQAQQHDKKAEAPAIQIEEKKEGTKIEEVKKEEKKEDKAGKKKEGVVKKENAVVRGVGIAISKKHSMSICKMIKRKTPDRAIELLEKVLLLKHAVPMNNREVPHRKGIMAGRFPRNASKEFILLLKQLKANASVNGIDNPVIVLAKADQASRPHRRGGTRAKRTHVYLEVRDKTKLGLK